MSRAYELARAENPHPNPRVGAVIISQDGEVLGEGAHEGPGRPHAEIVALDLAGSAAGATVYVTLEPCSHHGETPPCVDRLIAEARAGRGTIDATGTLHGIFPVFLAGNALRDMAEVQRSSDYLARNGIHLVWGPIRHLVGHNIAAYHRNPDDQRVEIFAEMDIMRDEDLGYFEPRPWHQDFPQRPKVWPADTLRAYWGFGSFGTFPGYP